MKYQEKKTINKENREVIWRHPGGKLRRLGSTSLTDTELLAVILGSGSSGRSAEEIADEIISKENAGERRERARLKIFKFTLAF